MDNIPTPPPRKSITQRNGSFTPQADEYDTPNGKNATPNGKGTGHRATSPRPNTSSPSEYLLRTTAARVNDDAELQRRKSVITVVPEPVKPVSATKKVVTAPSESLLKTTQARLSDKREWASKQGVIKHEDDPWWEVRKPAELAKNNHYKVESKLLDQTINQVNSARKKFPPRTTPDKLNVPGSTEKLISPAAGCSPTPMNVAKIDPNSALLRTTFNAQVKNVKNQPAPPPPAQPTIYTTGSKFDPKKVPSKLLESTTSARSNQWKSQDDLAKEQAQLDAEQAKEAKKISKPSPNLVAYNKSVASGARAKAVSVEGDHRELGWNQSFKKDSIPAIDQIQPLPAQKRASFGGTSPYRYRSSDGYPSPKNGVEPYHDEENVPSIPPATEELGQLDQQADVLDLNQEMELEGDDERNAYRYDVTGDAAPVASTLSQDYTTY